LIYIVKLLFLYFYRTRQSVDAKFKLTVEELTLFHQEITNLCCELKEADGVKYILDQVIKFQRDAEELEAQEIDCNIEKFEKCIEYGDSICIELPQLSKLKQVYLEYVNNNYLQNFLHESLLSIYTHECFYLYLY
jgi:hypothetical protein